MKSYDVTIQMKALCLYFHMLKSHDLFVKILENEIWKFARNLPLAKFGSERVKGESYCFCYCSCDFLLFCFLLFLVSNNTLLLGQRRPQA